ncbi:MAG TPA: hypothetical protein VGW36_06255 [Pyrinomonadaceae bacterium]|nr:hypothetical protein [Pyrinomonadaceae bacterium]
MISKNWSRKPIAVCVAVAIFSVYTMVVLASPAAKAPSGELSVSGNVTVNGETAVSGGTIFSDSVMTTADKSSATVNLSKMGRVVLSPSSNLKLSFNEKNLMGLLESGSVEVSTIAGIAVNFTTKDGVVVVDGSQPTSFTVNIVKGVTNLTTHSGMAELRVGDSVRQIAAGETATAGTPTPQGDTPGEDDDDLSAGEIFVMLAVGIAGGIGIWYAANHGNDLNFGGSVTVVSPTK